MATPTQKVQPRAFTLVQSYWLDDVEIRFQPVGNVPGFSHKVLALRQVSVHGDKTVLGSGWLGDEYRPGQKTARYFYCKLVLGDPDAPFPTR